MGGGRKNARARRNAANFSHMVAQQASTPTVWGPTQAVATGWLYVTADMHTRWAEDKAYAMTLKPIRTKAEEDQEKAQEQRARRAYRPRIVFEPAQPEPNADEAATAATNDPYLAPANVASLPCCTRMKSYWSNNDSNAEQNEETKEGEVDSEHARPASRAELAAAADAITHIQLTATATKPQDVCTVIWLDASGSMQDGGYGYDFANMPCDNLLAQLKRLAADPAVNPDNTCCFAFGEDWQFDGRNVASDHKGYSVQEFLEQVERETPGQWFVRGTSVACVARTLAHAHKERKWTSVNMIFLGDGNTERWHDFIADLTRLRLDHQKWPDPPSVASCIHTFTYQCVKGTSAGAANTLRDNYGAFVKPLVEQGVRVLPLEVATDDMLLWRVWRQMDRVASRAPPGWQSFGELMWRINPAPTRREFVTKLGGLSDDVAQRVLDDWSAAFKHMATCAPEHAQSGSYAQVYSVLKLFERQDLGARTQITAWLSAKLGDRTLTESARGALQRMLTDSCTSAALSDQWTPRLAALATEELVFEQVPSNLNAADAWARAVRDGSGEEMVVFLRTLMSCAKPCVRALSAPSGAKGLPLPSRARCEAEGRSFAEMSMYAARLLPMAWGLRADLAGVPLARACMAMLTMLTETIAPIRDLFEAAFLHDHALFDAALGIYHLEGRGGGAPVFAPPEAFGSLVLSDMRFRFFKIYEPLFKTSATLRAYFARHVEPSAMVLASYRAFTQTLVDPGLPREVVGDSLYVQHIVSSMPQFQYLDWLPNGCSATACTRENLRRMLARRAQLRRRRQPPRDTQAERKCEEAATVAVDHDHHQLHETRADWNKWQYPHNPEIGAEVMRLFRKHRAQPQVAAPLLHRECVLCYEEADKQTRVPLPCDHVLCDTCYDGAIRSAAYKPGAFLDMSAHRCPICRSQIITQPHPALPAPVAAFLGLPAVQLAQKLARKVEYRLCAVAHCAEGLFEAGPQECAADRETFPKFCPAHRAKDAEFFRCPNAACGMTYQHESGCSLMRCCPLGYHGCLEDRGRKCTHKLCGHLGPCDCAFRGCGQKWTISAHERGLGNVAAQFDPVAYALAHEDPGRAEAVHEEAPPPPQPREEEEEENNAEVEADDFGFESYEDDDEDDGGNNNSEGYK